MDRLMDTRSTIILARAIEEDWRKLGTLLNVEDDKMDAIEKQYNSEGFSEMAYRMLVYWKEKAEKNATIAVVIQHLRNMGHDAIVNKIENATPQPQTLPN